MVPVRQISATVYAQIQSTQVPRGLLKTSFHNCLSFYISSAKFSCDDHHVTGMDPLLPYSAVFLRLFLGGLLGGLGDLSGTTGGLLNGLCNGIISF